MATRKAKAPKTFGPFNALTSPQPSDDAADPKPAVLTGPPATHGSVKQAGIGDLLVVRQHVLGYAPGEVAYVENVAQGEGMVRTTRRNESVEDIVVTAAETSRSQERDVQSTERFDLRRESQEVLRSESARKPGSAESAAYGGVVETSGSTEQSQRAAETFGRDISTRAVSRVTDSLRVVTTSRRVQEFKETVAHTFDNTTGGDHEVVVYQWLDRVVQAQLFTYGKRVFYDLVLPEPAALWLRALSKRREPEGPLVKPAPFTIQASQLNEVNYLYYAAGYGATGVEPPPDPELVVAQPFANTSQNRYSAKLEEIALHEAKSEKIPIPPGYRAVTVNIVKREVGIGSDPRYFNISIGRLHIDLVTMPSGSYLLNGEVGMLPATLVCSDGQTAYSVNLEILCEPTERKMAEWRQSTHDLISQAARQRMQEYAEQSANLRAAIRMDELNFTLERKRSTEREELERACLTVLTNQHFDGLSAIEHSVQGYPEPFVPNVEPLGRYVRFFQQAFEWEQMTWRYYPYFWGRKQYWLDRLTLDDSDPQFRDFLRAGSARVLVSVRPGFEGAVAHFMETGIVPTGEELGLLASELYLPALGEETGADQAIEKATPFGEPWQIRAPTTLVKLRSGKTLPNWTSVTDAKGLISWAPGPGDPL